MRARANPIRTLRLAVFAFVAAIGAIAIVDSSLAVVLTILAIGALVLIVPFVAIHYDQHEELLLSKRPRSS
jgi:fatty acid desaturase